MRRIEDIRNNMMMVRSAVSTLKRILDENAIDSEEVDWALEEISKFLDWIGEFNAKGS